MLQICMKYLLYGITMKYEIHQTSNVESVKFMRQVYYSLNL